MTVQPQHPEFYEVQSIFDPYGTDLNRISFFCFPFWTSWI